VQHDGTPCKHIFFIYITYLVSYWFVNSVNSKMYIVFTQRRGFLTVLYISDICNATEIWEFDVWTYCPVSVVWCAVVCVCVCVCARARVRACAHVGGLAGTPWHCRSTFDAPVVKEYGNPGYSCAIFLYKSPTSVIPVTPGLSVLSSKCLARLYTQTLVWAV